MGGVDEVDIANLLGEFVQFLADGFADAAEGDGGGRLEIAGADELELSRVRSDAIFRHLEVAAVQAHGAKEADDGAEGERVVDRDGELDVAEVARAVHGAEAARGARAVRVDGSEGGVVQAVRHGIVEGVEEDGVGDSLDADASRLLGVIEGEGGGDHLLGHHPGLAEVHGGVTPHRDGARDEVGGGVGSFPSGAQPPPPTRRATRRRARFARSFPRAVASDRLGLAIRSPARPTHGISAGVRREVPRA